MSHEKLYTEVFITTLKRYTDGQRSGILDALKMFNESFDPVKKEIINHLVQPIVKSLNAILITNPKHWNHTVEGYDPFFIPFYKDIVSENRARNNEPKMESDIADSVLQVEQGFNNHLKATINLTSDDINSNSVLSVPSPQLGAQLIFNELLEQLKKGFQSLSNISKEIIDILRLTPEILNAFYVGLYNGLVNTIKGIFELVGLLLDTDALRQLFDSFEELIEQLKKEGFFKVLFTFLKKFLEKYSKAQCITDLSKILGEDLIEILLEIILAVVSGGTTAIKSISTFSKNAMEWVVKLFKDLDAPNGLASNRGLKNVQFSDNYIDNGPNALNKNAEITVTESGSSFSSQDIDQLKHLNNQSGPTKPSDEIKEIIDNVERKKQETDNAEINDQKKNQESDDTDPTQTAEKKKKTEAEILKAKKIKALELWRKHSYSDFFKSPPEPLCLVENSLVVTPNGLVKIQDLKVGDFVISYNFEKQTREPHKILQKFESTSHGAILSLEDNKLDFGLTPNHKTFESRKGGWLSAAEYYSSDESRLNQIEIFNAETPLQAYDLEIEHAHNFFVGKKSLLVHNSTGKKTALDFSIQTKFMTEFYFLVDVDERIRYAGKTIQNRDARERQHLNDEFKRKNGIIGSRDAFDSGKRLNSVASQANRYPLTPFETSIVETQLIMENGFPRSKKDNKDGSPRASRNLKKQLGAKVDLLKESDYLLNKQFPLSENNYRKWKDSFKNTWTIDSNPCIPFLNKIKV